MKIHERTDSYGWEGDGGLGDRLIAQIIAGKKTGTCCPLAGMSEEEIREWHANVGHDVTINDRHGTPRCNVRVVEVFETTLGDPAERLVIGEGLSRVDFISVHKRVWRDWAAQRGFELTDDLPLLAELFEFVDAPPITPSS
jgi:uncharacterized protein YhfF